MVDPTLLSNFHVGMAVVLPSLLPTKGRQYNCRPNTEEKG